MSDEKRSDHLSVPLSINSVSLWWEMSDGSKYVQTLERPTLDAIKDIPMFTSTDLDRGRELLRWRIAPRFFHSDAYCEICAPQEKRLERHRCQSHME